MDKQWYAVRTFNGYEHKVAEDLQKQIKKKKLVIVVVFWNL